MKILLIHNFYKSNLVGGEDVVFRNEVKLLKNYFGENKIFSYSVNNDKLNPLFLSFNIWFSILHFFRIFKIVKYNKIDICHFHNFYPVLTTSVFFAAKLAGAKTILTLHNYRLWCISGLLFRDEKGVCNDCTKVKYPLSGVRHKCFRGSRLQSIIATITFIFYRFIKSFDQIDLFLTLTPFQRDMTIELGLPTNKIVISPNFFPSNSFKRYKFSEKENYIFVGRLEHSKGIDVLLQAWKSLPSNFILDIIGSGPLESKLKSEYKYLTNINFLGSRTRDITLDCISKSRFLIHPSICYETFGLTILEALSLGTPVIGFNIGTRKDLIRHNFNGFLCSPDGLNSAIISSNTCSTYEDLSKNAIASSRSYQENFVIREREKIYNSLIKL